MTILQDILAAVGWQTRVNENFRSVAPAALYGIDPATTTGLTLGFLGGEFNGVTVANGVVVLAASATNYVVAHRTTGVVTAATNTTNWLNAGTYLQLYKLVAGGASFAIAATSDKRQAIGASSGGGGGGAVSSVNTQTGAVVLDTDDISEGATNLYMTTERVQDIVGSFVVAGTNMTITYNDASNTLTFDASGGGGGGAVSSVNGKTGAVSLALDDLSDVAAASPTTGYFLSWNGTAWVPAAGGGGGLTNFTAALSQTGTNSGVNVASLTALGTSGDVAFALVPKNAGALIAQIPDGTSAGGAVRGQFSVDWQRTRAASSSVAQGNKSVISGGNDNTINASGTHSVIGGGTTNFIGGFDCTISGGNGNTANGAYRMTIAGGSANTTSSNFAAIGGGSGNVADGNYSTICGGRQASTRSCYGAQAYAGGIFSAVGDAQRATYLQRISTTSATPTILTSDGAVPSSLGALVLPTGSAYQFCVYVIARSAATSNAASWKIEGAIKQGANAAATALVGTPTVTSTGRDSGASAWVVSVSANTTEGSLQINVTGAASTAIRWVAKIETVEVVG